MAPSPAHLGRSFAGAVTPQEEEEFRRLAALPNVYEVISRSIAPSIFGGTDMKKAIACLLFGGSRKRWESRLPRSGEGMETWPVGRQLPGGQVLNVLFLSPGPEAPPATFPRHLSRLPGSLSAGRGLIHAFFSRETPDPGQGWTVVDLAGPVGRALGSEPGDQGLNLLCLLFTVSCWARDATILSQVST